MFYSHTHRKRNVRAIPQFGTHLSGYYSDSEADNTLTLQFH